MSKSVLILLGIIAGCGSGDRVGDDYGDLTSSPSGLVLALEEHGAGWGRSDCLFCHPIANIHLENRTSIPIDMEEVRRIAVTTGEPGCSQCHGSNGTTDIYSDGTYYFGLKARRP